VYRSEIISDMASEGKFGILELIEAARVETDLYLQREERMIKEQ